MASLTDGQPGNVTTCGICLDTFKDPKTLPCLHTYCLKCLHDLTKKGTETTFKCPECRGQCTLPLNGVAGFKVNPTITYLLDGLKKQTNPPPIKGLPCDSCLQLKKQSEGVVRCVHCKMNLCGACRDTHEALLPRHKALFEIKGDLKTALKAMKEETIYCKRHPRSPLHLYCKDDQKLLCSRCYQMHHNGHTCESIKERTARNMKQINEVIAHSRELVNKYDKAVEDTHAYTNQLEESADATVAKLKRDVKDLVTTLHKHYSSQIENVTKAKDLTKGKAMSLIDFLEQRKIKETRQIKKHDNLVEYSHPIEIASLGEKIKNKQKGSYELDIPFSARVGIRFIAGRHSENNVELGRVIVNQTKPSWPVSITITPEMLHPNHIFGLAVTPAGDYIAIGGNKSAMYNSNHKLKKDFCEVFHSVAVTNDGKLAFIDGITNRIRIYKADGSYKCDVECRGLKQLECIAINKTGDLMVTDKKSNKMYSVAMSSWQVKLHHGTFKNSGHFVSNSKQVIITSDTKDHCVRGVATDGEELFKYGTRGSGDDNLLFPYGVCCDKSDYILVADSNNHRVVLLSPEGNFIRYLLTREDGVLYPYAVAIDNDGKLLVGDSRGSLFRVKYRK